MNNKYTDNLGALTEMPSFVFKGMKYAVLIKDFEIQTPVTGHNTSIDFVALHRDGKLIIKAGYQYDFGSGPAIDTPSVIYASLTHDAFYDLMNADVLTWKSRKTVDKFFRELLIKSGMNKIRAWVFWAGVRYGYNLMRLTQGKGFV